MNGMDRQLAAVAERQFGVFARRHAAAAGLSEYAMTRRVRSGRWEELFPGVYRLPGTTRTGRQRAMAAVLWAGDRRGDLAHDGGSSVAARLGSESRIAPDRATHGGSSAERLDASSLREAPAPTTWSRSTGFGVLRLPARSSIALRYSTTKCSKLRSKTLGGWGSRARPRWRGAPTSCAGGGGRARAAFDVCSRCSVTANELLESRLEVKLARLLRESSLPAAERQYPVGRFRLDFAWPAARIACECDGFEHHGARLAWKRDRGRLAAIEAAGWRVVHVTWDDVHALSRIRRSIASRSPSRAAAQARRPASVRRGAGRGRVVHSCRTRCAARDRRSVRARSRRCCRVCPAR